LFKGATFPAGTAIAVPTTSFIEWDGGNYIGRNAGVHEAGRPAGNECRGVAAGPEVVGVGEVAVVPGRSRVAGTGCTVNFASARQKKPACSFWMTSGQVPSGSTATVTPWSSVAPSTRLAAPQETSVGALPRDQRWLA
jgi:hypothetical protein